MMDEYGASYYIISGHTQKHVAGSSRIWYERLKVITLPRELVIIYKYTDAHFVLQEIENGLCSIARPPLPP